MITTQDISASHLEAIIMKVYMVLLRGNAYIDR